MAQQLLIDLTIHRHQGWNGRIICTPIALQHATGVALHLTDDITAAAGAAAQQHPGAIGEARRVALDGGGRLLAELA